MEASRFPAVQLLSSDLGLMAEYAGGRQIWIAATDLISARPVSGASLEVFDFQPFTLIGRVVELYRTLDYSFKGNLYVPKAILIVLVAGPISGCLNIQHHIVKDKVADFVSLRIVRENIVQENTYLVPDAIKLHFSQFHIFSMSVMSILVLP
jgi:hypothetical protein